MHRELPDEIWCSIWRDLDLHDRRKVTAVCRAWRHLAVNAPLVWQHIQLSIDADFTLNYLHNNVWTIPWALQHSGQIPLDVTVDIRLEPVDCLEFQLLTSTLMRFAECIGPYAERIISLTFNANDARAACIFWTTLSSGCGINGIAQTKNLSTLTFRYEGDEDTERAHFDRSGRAWEVYNLEWVHAPRLTTLDASCGLYAFSPGSLDNCSLTHITIGVTNTREIAEVMACATLRTARLLLRYYEFENIRPTPFERPPRAQELDRLSFEQLPWRLESAAMGDEYGDEELALIGEHRVLAWHAILWPNAARTIHLSYDPESFGCETPPDLGLAIFSSLPEDKSLVLTVTIDEVVTITAAEIDDANSDIVPFEVTLSRQRSVSFYPDRPEDSLQSLDSNLRVKQVRILCVDVADDWEDHWDEELRRYIEPLDAATRIIIFAPSHKAVALPFRSSQLEAWQKMLPAVQFISLQVRDDNRTVEEWEFESWEEAASTLHAAGADIARPA